MGGRGPPDHAHRRRLPDRLHRLLPGWPARLSRLDQRLPDVRTPRRDPVARGQGCGAVPAEVRRAVGVDPSSGCQGLRARRPRLAVVEPGSASLGRLADPAARPQGRVVGRRQDRAGASAAADRPGMAALLPRGPGDRLRVDLPARPGPAGPRRPDEGDRAGQRVGVRPADDLRALGRRSRRRVPVRVDPGRRRRHDPDVLRRGGLHRSASRRPACGSCSSTCRTIRSVQGSEVPRLDFAHE